MTLDKLDHRLLTELMKNSRTPLTALAKRLGASREVITYRLNRLVAEKVILRFVTEINIQKLCYVGAAVFIDVRAGREKEFREYLEKNHFVSWVAELSGIWSFGLSIYGKDNDEIDRKFLDLYQRFKEDIIDHRLTFHKRSHFFYEKYLEEKITPLPKRKSSPPYRIDQIDRKILEVMAANARIDYVELSKTIPLTAPAIAQRIRQLESYGFIEKYSIFVDLTKLDLFQYSIFIVNKNIMDRTKLLAHLSEHPRVSFIAEYVGEQFLEFGLFVKNPYELRTHMQKIEESFPDNRVIEISLFHHELVAIGPPACVFE